MPKLPTILNRELMTADDIFSSFLRIEKIKLRFSNGVERNYRRMQDPGRGAVLIVPLLDGETVLLIREYSAGVHRYEWQLPKGRVESNETIIQAANRELKEEVGKGARNLQHINSLTVLPGFMAHTTDIVVATDLYDERLVGDEPERLEVQAWSLQELYRLANQEDCTEARSIAALYLVRDWLLQN